MSIFQQGLDMFKGAAKALKEVDEDIPEEIEDLKPSKPTPKQSGLEEIKAQAREKVAKEMQNKDNIQSLLEKFKKFLSREKRNKMMMLCEKDDLNSQGFIDMFGFNRVLKSMGFRLLFDEVKNLITALNVYDEAKNRIFYKKIINSAFRKLYKREPFFMPTKMSQLQAVVVIQRFIKNKKKLKSEKPNIKKETITPKEILNGLVQKIQNSGRSLMRTFEDIDKDHSGFINLNELNVFFQNYGVNLDNDKLQEVFKIIDIEGIGKITYRSLVKVVESYKPIDVDVFSIIAVGEEEKEKFIKDMISAIKTLIQESKMTPENVFRVFDKENKGVISTENFVSNVMRIASGYSEFQVRQLFQYLDTSKDGFINRAEFGRVFFSIKEIQMMMKKQEDEKKILEEEAKKKFEEEELRKRMKSPRGGPETEKFEAKPTLQEEMIKKQHEIEEQKRREALKILDPLQSMREENIRKNQEAFEEKRKQEEEKQKQEEEKRKQEEEAKKKEEEAKKKALEEKKKRQADEKKSKTRQGKPSQTQTTPKINENKSSARSGSVKASSRSQNKKVPSKPTLEERVSKILQVPSEHAQVLRSHTRNLTETIKKEILYPLIDSVVGFGDSILLARQGQKLYESRPVIKHVYKWSSDWRQEITNPMPRSLWISGTIGRVGYIDNEGYLNQMDLLSGSCFPVLHLGTKPPFQRTPLLAGVCDSNIGRLYLLNKNWVIEIWELYQHATGPMQRLKILSKDTKNDYVENAYKNRYRNVFPKFIMLSRNGKIVVNATCVDGYLYCFEPISMTLAWKVRVCVRETQVTTQAEKAFEEFAGFLIKCEKFGINENRVFELLDRNGDGNLSYEEFLKAVKDNKLPLAEFEIRAMFKAMDVDGSGQISLDEFRRGIANGSGSSFPSEVSQNKPSHSSGIKIDSSSYPRDSIKYVIHKTLELDVDFYKICKDHDLTNQGSLPKDTLSSILLHLPIGLTAKHLKSITEQDFIYSSNSQVDYQQIFDKNSYSDLLKSSQNPLKKNFLHPESQENPAIVEDFEYLEDLNLIAYTTNLPQTSTIYIKNLSNSLIAKFVGHFGEMPPILFYIPSANILLSGERREGRSYIGPTASLPPCELFLWNLQKDFINKCSLNPPWTIKPYKRVYAHNTSFVDITYLPVTQLIVTTASDGCIKLWNPTGIPYSLTETHNLAIAVEKPGVYLPLRPQYTWTNEMLTCVGVLQDKEMHCYRVVSLEYDNCEWLAAMLLFPSTSKSMCGCLQIFGFKRLSLSVQARQHDLELPSQISSDLFNLFQKHRSKQLIEYRAGLAVRLEKIISNTKFSRTFEKEIKTSIIRSIIFECNYDNVFKLFVVLPDRINKGRICPEEFYNLLVSYAGFWSTTYWDFLKLLNNISENVLKELPEPPKRPHIGLVTLIEMIENKKNPDLGQVSPTKSTNSLLASIKNDQNFHETMFEAPIKELEQELFEYIALRLMQKKVPIGKLFEEMDTDQDGLISIEEFGVFLNSLGYNLRRKEVKSIMKCIDYNCDYTISYKELMSKLKEFGFTENYQEEISCHTWEDSSLNLFFKTFSEKNQFRSVAELFQYYDYNKDGTLLPHELLLALGSIEKESSERIMNIILVCSNNSLAIDDLAKAVNSIEKNLPRIEKVQISYKSMEKCLESYNVLVQLRKCVEDLGQYALSQNQIMRRGLELVSRRYRLNEGLGLLASGIIRFREVVDYLYAHALNRCYEAVSSVIIDTKYNVQINPQALTPITANKISVDDFKVDWESEDVISAALKSYKGLVLPGPQETTIYIYSPEGLKYVSRDGTALYTHVSKELSLHTSLQNRCKNLVTTIGIFEKYLGIDKTIIAFYTKPPGISLQNLLNNNGGLLKIPLLCNTKVSLYLFKYWGKKILNILETLHSYSISARYLLPESFSLSDNGTEIFLNTFRGIGHLDQTGRIISAPDLSLYINGDFMYNPFVAPEFYFSNSQTTAVDVWNFGALMFTMLFGHPPKSFVEAYEKWQEKKFVKGKVVSGTGPAFSFPYNVFEGYEIMNGRACEVESTGIGVGRSLRIGSFGGIVRETLPKTEIDEIEDMYKTLKDLKNTKPPATSDTGKVLDLIFLCLQIDPKKRPTIKALLNSPVFSLTKYEEKQAISFASLIFSHKNPEIIITQHITKPLNLIKSTINIDNSEETINLIEKLGTALLNFEDSIGQNTTQAISSSNLSAKEKESILKKNLSSPITELANQCMKDDIFNTLCYLSLNFFHLKDPSVLLAYSNLLKYLLFHLNSEESGLTSLVSVLIEVLLKMFIGEDTCLASKDFTPGYVLKESFWTPELYDIMGPIYRQNISESGYGHNSCPIIKEYLSKTRHCDYFSELMMIAENFNLIQKEGSTTVARRNALRHIKSMLQTRNHYKTLASLDFKIPQVAIHCLQDKDYKVRAEAIEIFALITEGCIQPLLPKLPGATKNYRALGIINFFSTAKKETHETTKNFEKFSKINDTVPGALREMAICFENPMFIFPIVRLLKLKSEPHDTKEVAAKILVNILGGSEKCQLACLSPITDTISTLCKCMVVSMKNAEKNTEKNTDKKAVKNLPGIIKEMIGKLLAEARGFILANFKNTPGAEALLKEQGLIIPEKVTLQDLERLIGEVMNLKHNIQGIVQGLKNWLLHEKLNGSFGAQEKNVIDNCMKHLRECLDHYWNYADIVPNEENYIERSQNQLRNAKEKIKLILLFFEWALFSDLDCGWFKSEDNVCWLVNLTILGLKSAGSEYEMFCLEEELMLMQRILCRLAGKSKVDDLLTRIAFGQAFAYQLILQYDRLGRVITKHTEPLHVLHFYSGQSQIRLATFVNLLEFPSLQKQFLDTEFIEVLIKDYLNDYKVLSARFNKLSIEFLPFRETPPIRSEAINIIMTVLKEKTKCKLIYDDVLQHLQRYKTIEYEILNVQSINPVVQATSLELLQAFISSNDPHLEYLLMQANGKCVFTEVFAKNPELSMRFPVIAVYCKV